MKGIIKPRLNVFIQLFLCILRADIIRGRNATEIGRQLQIERSTDKMPIKDH